jgi:type IV pilus biogenesis protein CpaD/CtpE
VKSVLIAALLLTGCASTDRLVQVKVPLPVACQVVEPARPMMDTETVLISAPIDELARAMRAEIERREGYEGQLRAALNACQQIEK